MHPYMSSLNLSQPLDISTTIRHTFFNAPQFNAVPEPDLSVVSLIRAMQSRPAICGAMQRHAGERRLWPLLMVYVTSAWHAWRSRTARALMGQ
jgi:hypothetical protein